MAPLDIAVLQRFQPSRRAIRIYYRHVFIPNVGPPDPLRTSSTSAGRWGTPDGTLYTGVDEPTVWSEYCRNAWEDLDRADPTGGVGLNRANFSAYAARDVGSPVPLRALYSVEVVFDSFVDLTTPVAEAILDDAGFDRDDLHADSFGECPAIATAGDALGWQALLAPSAAWQRPGGYCVPIFRSGRPVLAAFRLLAEAARPSVAVAFLTTYRAGERPGWLSMPVGAV